MNPIAIRQAAPVVRDSIAPSSVGEWVGQLGIPDLVAALLLVVMTRWVSHQFQKRRDEIRDERAKLAEERARSHEAEIRLADERQEVYQRILDPYTEVLVELGRGGSTEAANQRLSSVEHRKAAFQLKLVASDEVVHAFNTFQRYIVDVNAGTAHDSKGQLIKYWASLLVAIRRSVSGPETTVTAREMVEEWVADIDDFWPRDQGNSVTASDPP